MVPAIIIKARKIKKPGLKNCHHLGCARQLILDRFFLQLIENRYRALIVPMMTPDTRTAPGQKFPGERRRASNARLAPLINNTKPPPYQQRADRITRLRVVAWGMVRPDQIVPEIRMSIE